MYLSEFNELFLNFYSSNIPTKTVLCDDKDSPLMYDGVRTLLPKNQAQTQTWKNMEPLKNGPDKKPDLKDNVWSDSFSYEK